MKTIPIIKIQLETMQQEMHHAFSQQLINLDEQFQKAIAEACHPDKIQHLLNDYAATYIKKAMEEEIRWFFMNGDGRETVKERVIKQLSEWYVD